MNCVQLIMLLQMRQYIAAYRGPAVPKVTSVSDKGSVSEQSSPTADLSRYEARALKVTTMLCRFATCPSICDRALRITAMQPEARSPILHRYFTDIAHIGEGCLPDRCVSMPPLESHTDLWLCI
jgi:hypothetical protein